jgi:hypothetical protein
MSMGHVCVKMARADRGQVTNSCLSGEHGNVTNSCLSGEHGKFCRLQYTRKHGQAREWRVCVLTGTIHGALPLRWVDPTGIPLR